MGRSDRGWVFVVGRMYPPGNTQGQFHFNVPSGQDALCLKSKPRKTNGRRYNPDIQYGSAAVGKSDSESQSFKIVSTKIEILV